MQFFYALFSPGRKKKRPMGGPVGGRKGAPGNFIQVLCFWDVFYSNFMTGGRGCIQILCPKIRYFILFLCRGGGYGKCRIYSVLEVWGGGGHIVSFLYCLLLYVQKDCSSFSLQGIQKNR